jgi:transposase
MNIHKNAPLTPKGREAMVRSVVEGGLSQADAAYQFNTTPKTVAKWVKRFRAEGVEGLRDRSSRPLSSPSQTLPATCAAIEALRRQRHTGKQIAAEVAVSPATVSRILRRLGLNRIRYLEPAEPERRYERESPARSFISISKSSGVSSVSATASPAIGRVRTRAAALAGISYTSALTTIPASPSRRSSPTKRPTALYPFSGHLWLITKASASPSLA